MQPKVLQVLLFIAQHQGHVVRHDDILAAVWPDMQVESNTLQRCIVQLRKAFDDNAKAQQVIATHPTVGYSLVPPVEWISPPGIANNIRRLSLNQKLSRTSITLLSLVSLIVAPLLIANFSQNELQLTHLKMLTSSDSKEYAPAISPDGQHLLFQRHLDSCKSQIWAINTQTNREYLITEEAGIYGRPSWSPSGGKIAFPSAHQCDLEKEGSGCREIRTVSFPLAKVKPQKSSPLVRCEKENFDSLVWLADDEIAFLASDLETTRVKSFKVTTKSKDKLSHRQQSLDLLYQNKSFRPYSIDFSPALNKLIIMESETEQSPRMTLLDVDSGDKEHVQIALPEEYSEVNHWRVVWHPQRQTILTSDSNSLFEIDLAGSFTQHPQPLSHQIYGLDVDHNSSEIFAAIGKIDTDIGELRWSPEKSVSDESFVTQHRIFNRSNAMESNAQLQPGGKSLAFVSNRHGTSQLWLKSYGLNNDSIGQLTKNSKSNAEISAFTWSQDGQSLIYLQEGRLHLVSVKGEETAIKTPFKVLNLFQSLPGDKVLLSVSSDHTIQIVVFNLGTGKFESLYEGSSRWAQLGNDNLLYITDIDAKFYRIVDQTKQPIEALASSLNWHKFFSSKDKLIFLDDDNWLKKYSPSSNLIIRQTKIPEIVLRVTDIAVDQKRLFFSQVVSNEKEIAVFYK